MNQKNTSAPQQPSSLYMSNMATHLFAKSMMFLAMLLPSHLVWSEQSGSDQAREAYQQPVDPLHTNTLGMTFVEVPGTNLLWAQHETTVQAYKKFLADTQRSYHQPDFDQEPNHPAVNVSWEDAIRFCRWLTAKEIASEDIKPNQFYRLPTTQEWSRASGIKKPAQEKAIEQWHQMVQEFGNSIDDQARVVMPSDKKRVYPWGKAWPPPRRAGNYHPKLKIDPYRHTAPVGSFLPNQFGLFDMGGNVWEWNQDHFEGSDDFRTLRGGSWRMFEASAMLTNKRIGNLAHIRLPGYGFRIVLAEKQTE